MLNYTAGMTDQYCLTMSESFMKRDMNDLVTFSLFARSFHKNRGYSVAMGIETAINALVNLSFTEAEVDHIGKLGYDPQFVEYIRNWKFTGNVRALTEGTVIAPQTPILEVEAPRVDATLVESLLLSIIGQQTLIATKAARIKQAAKNKPCWDFSLRRLHGPHASYGVARSSHASGFEGTATIAAAAALGIPSAGTMAHQYIMARGEAEELQAFKDFLVDNPVNNTLLPDTFDTITGIKRAIQASQETGISLQAIRLDSGDLVELSQQGRALLDAAGMTDTKIMASNDLDEYEIYRLEKAGAQIDAYGIGTRLGTGHGIASDGDIDTPAMGVVYKICLQHEREPRYAMKNAPGKQTDPGAHQVWRTPEQDLLGLDDENHQGQKLLSLAIKDGKRCRPEVRLDKVRKYVTDQLEVLPENVTRLEDPVQLELKRTNKLLQLREQLTQY